MLQLNKDHLTETEKSMYDILAESVKNNTALRIVEAAKQCNVSPSKVSKFIQKLGFENFKQFKLYFSGQELNTGHQKESTELKRLYQYINNFNPKLVEQFISRINRYEKIILYGLGPSFICAEYFGYKLATVTDKNITVTQFEDYAGRLADQNTLLLVFSVTGTFSFFDQLFNVAKKNNADSMLVLEEYRNTSIYDADYIFHLTEYQQNNTLLPFEKTRTIFFIFMEEVIGRLKELQNASEADNP